MKGKKQRTPPRDRTGNVLTLQLRRKWFDLIAGGYKRVEFRTVNEYWQRRIEGKEHSHILFRNGYGVTRPSMLVDYLGWSKGTGARYYTLRLGDVARIWNYEPPGEHGERQNAGCAYDWLRPWYDNIRNVWMPTFYIPMFDHTTTERRQTISCAPDTAVRAEGYISTEPRLSLDNSARADISAFLMQEGLIVSAADDEGEDGDGDYVILSASSEAA
jgi:hypothetical protein